MRNDDGINSLANMRYGLLKDAIVSSSTVATKEDDTVTLDCATANVSSRARVDRSEGGSDEDYD